MPVSIDRPAVYKISVQGRLQATWTAWFDGASITTTQEGGCTVSTLTAVVVDQSELHGLLERVRDLGLTLVRVERLGGLDGMRPPVMQ